MNRNLTWRFLFIVLVVAWAIWELYPPTPRNLVEEFRSSARTPDATLNAIVDQAKKLEAQFPNRSFQNLKQAIGTNDVTKYFPTVRVEAGSDATRAILQQLQRDAAGKIKLGLDLQGGTSFQVELDTNRVAQTDRAARERVLAQAIEVLRKRVDRFGVAEPLIQPVGENRVLIQLPGLSEAEKEDARTQISKAAFLEFRMVHTESRQLLEKGLTAPGYEVLWLKERKDKQGQPMRPEPFLVKKHAELGLTGNYVKRAYVTQDALSNRPEIALEFDSKGKDLFADITTKHTRESLAIVLDGELYSAPRIDEPIVAGNAVIRGDFTYGEAFGLANILQNPLETPVKIVAEQSVEPSLGKDSIRSGLKASLIGTIAVAAFMLVYYLFSGLLANIALMLNIVILLGAMCSFETTLTLPGIAGIVLTIGMAVDANVLIYERIREELEGGKSIRGAVAAGYDKAFGTIFDSNLTTLIASVILIFMGTGPVKGFGVSLTIGIIVSMFTALVVTRLIFDWMLAKGWLQKLTMMRLINPSKLDFLRWSKPAFALSWALVIVGTAYGISRGKDALGIDFRGGDQQIFAFSQKVTDVAAIRDALSKGGIAESMIQYQKDLGAGTERLQITSPGNTADKVRDVLNQQFPNAKFVRQAADRVGGVVAQEILKTALIAVLLSLFGILVYVAFRYEFSFAVGAVVAVIHDVFMTIGLFCLTGRQFNASMVAAILTIVGFSINDTIVIFDRIREDLKLGVRGSFKDLINHALNRTLSRTIITSGTVFLATISLYIFGGQVINDFAFTFLVGIVTGTYSSIYIASALVLWWYHGERPKTGSTSQVTMENTVAARA